jgi:hypothetical protein
LLGTAKHRLPGDLTVNDLHEDLAILDALGEIDRPEARARLIAAIHQRLAGHAFGREYAIRSLVRWPIRTYPTF